MLFNLTAHTNGEFVSVAAERSGRMIVLRGAGSALARNLNQATKAAAEILGPMLADADRTGKKWGLHVAVESGAAAVFGEFPPEPASPQLHGPEAKPSDAVARIHRQWARDGSAVAALDAAIKIIDTYVGRRRRRQAAA